VQRFAAKADRLEAALGLEGALRVMFGFVIHPSARQGAAAHRVRVVASRPG
jgi:hypothetical protein